MVAPTLGATFDYNLWYGGGSVDGDAVGANDITSDPLLTLDGDTSPGNLTGEHFKIQSGSPAIGEALEDGDSPADDFFGTTRADDDIEQVVIPVHYRDKSLHNTPGPVGHFIIESIHDLS